jgi:hypothetical protein
LRHIVSKLLEWSILTNVFIALAAMSYCLCGQAVLTGKIGSWSVAGLVFFATWCMYQWSRWKYYTRYEKHLQVQDNLFLWLERHPDFTRNSILFAAVGAMFCLLLLRFETILVLAVAGVVSLLYALPRGLRLLPYAKIVFIALTWAIIGVLLPAAELGLQLTSMPVVCFFIFQFVFILFVTLPFDMSDIQADKDAGIRTIPMMIGFDATKWLVMVMGAGLVLGIQFGLRSPGILNDVQSAAAALVIALLVARTGFLPVHPAKWKIMLVYDGAIIIYSILLIMLT